MKKRIYLIVDSSAYAGIESHLLHLSILLKRKHGAVTLVFLKDYGPHLLEAKLIIHKVECLKLNGKLSSLIKLVSRLQPNDIVHTHGYKAGILCRLVCKIKNQTCVSTFHAGEPVSGKLAVYTWLDKLTARFSTNIAVSEKINRYLGGKGMVLDNFISPLPFKSINLDANLRIGFVGRLSHEKGPDIFIDVAKHFLARKSVTFSLYGDGPLASELQKEAATNVDFKGFCKNMESEWQNIDILLISSRAEGMPMVAIEAMMQGILVVSTPCGAMPKLLARGRGEISQEISPQSLIYALARIVALPPIEKTNMAQQAHQYVAEHCTGAKQWREYEAIYSL